ncbi:MAG: asparagine synthase-related protein [Syntrophomonadaceae bacterium]|nr:asparagine synthase-related protein [Syntrophomonadaceae bacterium]
MEYQPVRVIIKHSDIRKVYRAGNSVAIGSLFYKGRLYSGRALLELASSWPISGFHQELNTSTGHFALILEKKDQFVLAVDRLRSIPLFMAKHGDTLFVGDDSVAVACGKELEGFDPVLAFEFLLCGYVTGADTLCREVRQLRPGHYAVVNAGRGTLEVKDLRYYEFVHHCGPETFPDEAIDRFDQTLTTVFRRLVDYANGRTIVVPLSGGFDSRLVVLMLKRLGYDNVIAFSYGCPGNKESSISQRVAGSLGIPWRFLPYSHESWVRWWNSPERVRYWSLAHQLSAVPHIQDWPAVWQMYDKKDIPHDSVFVPGHSADLLAGSRSSVIPGLYRPGGFDIADVAQLLFKNNYCLWDPRSVDCDVVQSLEVRIVSNLEHRAHHPDAASLYEVWDVEERQAKFIVNSVRAYEQWGFDWWLPFWDAEYLDYWAHCPLDLRIGKTMYEGHVSELYRNLTGVSASASRQTERSGLRSRLRHRLSTSRFSGPLRCVYRRTVKSRTEYHGHPLAWYSVVGQQEFRRRFTGRENINSFLSREILHSWGMDIWRGGKLAVET